MIKSNNLTKVSSSLLNTCCAVLAFCKTTCELAARNTRSLGQPFCIASSGIAAGCEAIRVPEISNTSKLQQWFYTRYTTLLLNSVHFRQLNLEYQQLKYFYIYITVFKTNQARRLRYRILYYFVTKIYGIQNFMLHQMMCFGESNISWDTNTTY